MNVELAQAGIARAKRWLQGAERALQDNRWDDAVYTAQMAVEQGSKAVLIALGIDYPKEHDVSDVLFPLKERKDLPTWFRDDVPPIAEVVAELAEQRGLAGYGFETGVDAEHFRSYSPEAYQRSKKALDSCSKLIDELFMKKSRKKRGEETISAPER